MHYQLFKKISIKSYKKIHYHRKLSMDIIFQFILISNTTIINLKVCITMTIPKIKSFALVRGSYTVAIRL